MKKIIAALFIAIIALVIYIEPAYAAGEVRIFINTNNEIEMEDYEKPFIDENGRTLVPIRIVSESLGAKVDWEKAGNVETVTITKGSNKIVLKVGSNKAMLNGQEKVLDTQAVRKGEKIFVPVRFVSECLGAKVDWINTPFIKNSVNISDNTVKYIPPIPKYPKTKIDCTATILPITPEEVEPFDPAVAQIIRYVPDMNKWQYRDGTYDIYYSNPEDKSQMIIYLGSNYEKKVASIFLYVKSEYSLKVLKSVLMAFFPENYEEVYSIAEVVSQSGVMSEYNKINGWSVSVRPYNNGGVVVGFIPDKE